MTFEEAVRKSMRVYWNETNDFDQLGTSQGGRKYNKKYFDSIEEEMLPSSSALAVKKEQSKEVLKKDKKGKK